MISNFVEREQCTLNIADNIDCLRIVDNNDDLIVTQEMCEVGWNNVINATHFTHIFVLNVH